VAYRESNHKKRTEGRGERGWLIYRPLPAESENAAIRGIETSLVAPLTLGRIRRCVRIENPSLRQVAVAIPILGLFSA
jgi:hypothetical protein